MRTENLVALIALGACVVPNVARSDMGMFAIDEPQAKLYEPTQDALIAWNGTEEILHLRTVVYSSHRTKVLEILPLPAEPAVSKGSAKAFDRVQELIDARQRPRPGFSMGDLGGGVGDEPPAGRVTQRKVIGAHDISVATVLDAPRFAAWVESYLKDRKLPRAKPPDDLLALITTYTREGFRWFVLDVVQVEKRRVNREPIQYRFKTGSLYFPLRISRRALGQTRVELTYLTPRPIAFSRRPAAVKGKRPAVRCSEPFRAFRVGAKAVHSIDAGIEKLIQPAKDARTYLGRMHCVGKLALFDQDLAAGWGPEPKVTPRSPRHKTPGATLGDAPPAGELGDPF